MPKRPIDFLYWMCETSWWSRHNKITSIYYWWRTFITNNSFEKEELIWFENVLKWFTLFEIFLGNARESIEYVCSAKWHCINSKIFSNDSGIIQRGLLQNATLVSFLFYWRVRHLKAYVLWSFIFIGDMSGTHFVNNPQLHLKWSDCCKMLYMMRQLNCCRLPFNTSEWPDNFR